MTWSEALDAYLTKRNIPGYRFAQALGVSPSVVHYWRKGSEPHGDRGREMKDRVEQETHGEVPAAPWAAPKSLPPTGT